MVGSNPGASKIFLKKYRLSAYVHLLMEFSRFPSVSFVWAKFVCGSVRRAVDFASPQIKSRHRQKFIYQLCNRKDEKDEK